ncbi:hypothetical protein ColKHC_14325 [Colletotrichum higginsianum]|nr:hypothetical protein ColKHC_14325 [Colletotrichum higginsianum]
MGILIFSVTLRNCPPLRRPLPRRILIANPLHPSGQQAPPSPDNTDSELPEEQKAEECRPLEEGSRPEHWGRDGTVRVAGGRRA